MTRMVPLIFCAALGLWACGSSIKDSPDDTSTTTSTTTSTATKDPIGVVPLDNDISGWTVDRENAGDPTQRARTATTETGVESLIDGGAEDYFVEPNIPTMFLWQNYLNSSLEAAPEGAKVKLYIFQLPSADEARGIYTALLQTISHAGNWEALTPTLGTESRIQDTNTQWWINFRKDVFYVEVLLYPSYGPPPDYALGDAATRAEAVRFAEAIASKI
jgi:hypothetical protein